MNGRAPKYSTLLNDPPPLSEEERIEEEIRSQLGLHRGEWTFLELSAHIQMRFQSTQVQGEDPHKHVMDYVLNMRLNGQVEFKADTNVAPPINGADNWVIYLTNGIK